MQSTTTWVNYDSSSWPSSVKLHPLPFLRRPHAKSRLGCRQCKKRRIKCDESHPSCSQCVARRSICSYSVDPKGGMKADNIGIDDRNGTLQYDLATLGPKRVAASHESFAAAIQSVAHVQKWCLVAPVRTYVELLTSFNNRTLPTLSSPIGQQVIWSKVTELFDTYSFLFHAALALSATHARLTSGLRRDFNIIATYHTQQALRLYGERLRNMSSGTEADAMLAACFMLTILYYPFVDDRDFESWIFPTIEHETKPKWSTILSGPTLLLQSCNMHGRAEESSWLPFMLDSQERLNRAAGRTGSGESFVKLLRDLIDENVTKDSITALETSCRKDAYSHAFASLAPVLMTHLDPITSKVRPCTDVADFISLVRFPSSLNKDFIDLLAVQDSLAVLLVGLWFALVAQLESCEWWSTPRALFEGKVILRYLRSTDLADWRFQKAMSVLEGAFDE